MSLKADLLSGGAIAPASMVPMTSHHMMIRGPMVAYAAEAEAGAAAGGEPAAEADVGGEEPVDLAAAGDDDPDAEAGAADDDPDLEDYDHDGKALKIPATLAQRLREAADVEVQRTAVRRDAERYQAAQQATQAQAASAEALMADRVKVETLNQQVTWYEEQNWTALQAQDAERAQELWMAYQQLKLTRDKAATEFETKRKDHVKKVQDDDVTRLRAVEASLADPTTGIKGWGPKLLGELGDFAAENGISPARLKHFDVADWKLLHLANAGQKALQKQTETQRHAKAQLTRPATTVGARTPPPPPLSDGSATDAWMKARTAQVSRPRA